jgi:hypothetical protein
MNVMKTGFVLSIALFAFLIGVSDVSHTVAEEVWPVSEPPAM